jgi:hypothetical protein
MACIKNLRGVTDESLEIPSLRQSALGRISSAGSPLYHLTTKQTPWH